MLSDYDNFEGNIFKEILSGESSNKYLHTILRPVHYANQIMPNVLKITHKVEKFTRPFLGTPLGKLSHTLERVTIRPVLHPIAAIMPKITVGGHRYDLGGSRMLIKTTAGVVGGAVGGFVTKGGPYGALYGAIAGGVAANLQKGEPNVGLDLLYGAEAGMATGAAMSYAGISGTTGTFASTTTATDIASASTGEQITEGAETGYVEPGADYTPTSPDFIQAEGGSGIPMQGNSLNSPQYLQYLNDVKLAVGVAGTVRGLTGSKGTSDAGQVDAPQLSNNTGLYIGLGAAGLLALLLL